MKKIPDTVRSILDKVCSVVGLDVAYDSDADIAFQDRRAAKLGLTIDRDEDNTKEIMNIYIESNRKARLANYRVRIVRGRAPWSDMDLVFNPKSEDVADDPLYDATQHDEPLIERKCGALTFYTNKSRIKELCGDDPKFFTDDGIDKLCWEQEKNEIKMWVNGEIFGYVVEEWDEGNRSWKHVNSYYGYYGINAVLDEVKDIECECICCDDDVKYNIPDGMLVSYDPNYLGE